MFDEAIAMLANSQRQQVKMTLVVHREVPDEPPRLTLQERLRRIRERQQ
jgi:hypothetical protein